MRILEGDCIEQMRKLPDNSVDAIVTDPPYHLTINREALRRGQCSARTSGCNWRICPCI
jgi:DNA modification methylase